MTVRNALKKFDFVIVGGGGVGYSLALGLLKNPRLKEKSFLLLEKSKGFNYVKSTNFPHTRSRVYLTNPASVNFFDSVGVWEHTRVNGANKIDKIKVWDDFSGDLTIDTRTDKVDFTSYMVDNTVLVSEIYKNVQENLNEKLHKVVFDTSVSEIKNDAHGVTLKLTNNEEVSCSLLFGCDGHMSKVRELSNIGSFCYDYNVTDTVTTVYHSDKVEKNVAYKKFTPHGSIALLSLGDGVTSLSWCAQNPLGEEIRDSSDEKFLELLNYYMLKNGTEESFGTFPFSNFLKNGSNYVNSLIRPGYVAKTSLDKAFSPVRNLSFDSILPNSRQSFPLRMIFSKQFVKDSVVLMGDAAHRLHPISGQGFNCGIGDVIEMLKTLEEMQFLGYDFKNANMLKEFNRKRMLIAGGNGAFGTLLKNSFTGENFLSGVVRSTVLNAADAIRFEKLVRKATH